MRKVAGLIAHGSTMRFCLRHKCVSAVVGDIEPFMSIGGPGMSFAHAADEKFIPRAGGGPHAEGAIHVDPCTVFAREGDQRLKMVKASGINVTRLQKHKRWMTSGFFQCAFKRGWA